ncbi:bile acid:sodium symporter family protein [Croceivirga thetidis]|uniref:Bile acid:sodium symporter family protein n=1 Tax=Croceivirga thetidis TaxID=2721623 RepID=A0ABX1GUS0_9FLAO|nr:bile acid:sodium symporter family protein [Croceivirga thetidis]NKI32781.1 bile acid:sodium symporter family protein [Croceivirga thetidis]
MAELLSTVFLPLSLAIIMLGMGMTLTLDDFKRILVYPKSVLLGLTNQLILLPIIAFAITVLFKMEALMAIGLMVLAVSPGGPTSNLITHTCKGNIALSVTLTAIASFITILTIPLILSKTLDYFGSTSDVVIKLPVVDTILQVMVITVIPISIGMLIKKFKPKFSQRMEKPMRTASAILFILVLVAVIAANSATIARGLKEVGLVTLVLNLATMGLGYLTSRLFKLDFKSTISITIESGIQNGTLAFVIVSTILLNTEMGIPIAAYSIWMFITGGILMWVLGRRKHIA